MRCGWRKQVTNCASAMLMLLCGLGLLQPSANGVDESPFLFDPSKDWTTEPLEDGKTTRLIIRLRCPKETLPKTTQNPSNSSIVQTILLKGSKDAAAVSIAAFPYMLGKWVTENSDDYFPCGHPINLVLVRKAIAKLNAQVLQEALVETETDPDTEFGVLVTATAEPIVEENSTLIVEVRGKPIREVLISTQCNWQNRTIDISGTVAVRGDKPDALIRQTVGLKPGDHYPISTKVRGEIHDRIYSLGLFNAVQSFSAIDVNKDPDTITWLICIKQKSEAELAYLEASQINSSASVESAKQVIARYQDSIQHFRRSKNAPPASKLSLQNLVTLPIMTLYTTTAVAREPTEADALVGLATTYLALGEFYQALNYYNQALSLARMTNERDAEANILSAIADIYTTLGDREQAHGYYKQALSTRLSLLRQQDSGGRKP
jgi:hypothetical protein